jgi:predicted lipoprotein with Yx(FWY)xxD motif
MHQKPGRRMAAGWRLTVLLAVGALVIGACTRVGTGTPPASAAASEEASQSAEASMAEGGGEYEITVSQTSAGSALAGVDGMTLYVFDQDTGSESTCTGSCAENWPPFTVDEGEHATAGDGVTGEIGETTRDDGTIQVTYNGHPLYYFAGDQAAGDANGDGVGGVWHIATPESDGASSSDGIDY